MRKTTFTASILLCMMLVAVLSSFSQNTERPKEKILIIASNGAISTQTGWPIGAWYSEVTHPYWEFTQAGYEVEFASPEGGQISFDPYSDPEHESKLSASDLISLGFKKSADKTELVKNSKKVSAINASDYKAIFISGGLGPMQTMYKNSTIEKFVVSFYQSGKPVGIICHATSILLHAKLPSGKLIVEGKKWTGYSNLEEDILDNNVNKKVNAFRIEEEAKKIVKTQFSVAPPFVPYVVRDGNLVTGQQQSSGSEAAKVILDILKEKRK